MLSFGVDIPFVELLGFTLHRMENGESELHYETRPEHLNSFAITHGGVSMTLLDVTMAIAARSSAPNIGAVTIEMKTNFMQAARGRLVAKGKLLHRTATLAFTEATIFDAQGRICCHATGTFKYVRRLPVSGSSTHALQAIATD